MERTGRSIRTRCRRGNAAKDESEPGSYFVFDTFNDEAAREAHMNGEAGQEFVANKDRLFSDVKIHRLAVVAGIDITCGRWPAEGSDRDGRRQQHEPEREAIQRGAGRPLVVGQRPAHR